MAVCSPDFIVSSENKSPRSASFRQAGGRRWHENVRATLLPDEKLAPRYDRPQNQMKDSGFDRHDVNFSEHPPRKPQRLRCSSWFKRSQEDGLMIGREVSACSSTTSTPCRLSLTPPASRAVGPKRHPFFLGLDIGNSQPCSPANNHGKDVCSNDLFLKYSGVPCGRRWSNTRGLG